LMLALYRSGRRGSALEAYHRLRVTLSRELGLDPSPAIQELQRAMLSDDPALERADAAAGPLRVLSAG
jgi:DNA-binding SARP family transcriptional activator